MERSANLERAFERRPWHAATEPGVERECGPSDLKRAQDDVAQCLSWLERSAALALSRASAAGLSCSHEDLAQLVLLTALMKLERHHRATGELPEWSQPEDRLHAYLRGILARSILRRLRDARARREVGLPMDALSGAAGRSAQDPCAELKRACAPLSPSLAGEREVSDLAADPLRLSPAARAKRRTRAVNRLRDRCRSCSRRIEEGCGWLPRGWLGAGAPAARASR